MGLTGYTGPVYSVKIVRPVEGSTLVDFSSWSDSYNLSDGNKFPFLQSLSVTEMMNGSNSINIKLTPPFDHWKLFLEKVGEHLFKSFVEVKLGYKGLMSQTYTAQLVNIPDITIEAGFVDVELEGRGGVWAASRVRTNIMAAKGKPLEDMKAIKVIQKIAEKYDIKIYYRHPDKGEVEFQSPPSSLSNLEDQMQTVPQGNDFHVIRDIVVMKARYGFYNRGKRLVIFNPAEIGKKKVTPIYTFRGDVDPQNNRFPIVDFTSQTNKSSFVQGVRKVRNQSVNKDKKEVETEEVTGQEKGSWWQFLRKGKMKAGTDDQKPQNVKAPNRHPDKKAKLWYEKNAAEELSGIDAEITTMGNPALTPGQTVRVHNIGAMFDGHYYVREVTHEGSADGYTTSFSGFTFGGAHNLNEFMERVRKDKRTEDSGEKPPQNKSDTTKKDVKESSQG